MTTILSPIQDTCRRRQAIQMDTSGFNLYPRATCIKCKRGIRRVREWRVMVRVAYLGLVDTFHRGNRTLVQRVEVDRSSTEWLHFLHLSDTTSTASSRHVTISCELNCDYDNLLVGTYMLAASNLYKPVHVISTLALAHWLSINQSINQYSFNRACQNARVHLR